ncbi:MAG: Synerg-CTERM system glutamic-type intramembrane protease MrtS [Synergistaceae bacterium]|nr:Synerg-CTERM system glutamic-type intramembrane protease MrtS [Synergistaceae bacterium]
MNNFWSLTVAVVMLYFPYVWCRFRKEDASVYGLEWRADRRSLRFTLVVSAAVLLLLTPVALCWRGANLPFHRDAGTVFDMLGAGLAAAVIEETFFRGWLQTLLKRYTSIYVAVVCVNVLFAASHLVAVRNLWLLATFFPGLVMSFLRERYDNVLPAMIFHFLGNVWAIWFFPL